MTISNFLFTLNTPSLSLTEKRECAKGKVPHLPTLNLPKQNLCPVGHSEGISPAPIKCKSFYSSLDLIPLGFLMDWALCLLSSHPFYWIISINIANVFCVKKSSKHTSDNPTFFCSYCPISLHLFVKQVEHVIKAHCHLFTTSD